MQQVIVKTHDTRILVVDDNEVNRMIAQTILEQYEVRVDLAESGMEAIDKIKRNFYDLVILDYLMPSMDGLATAQEIRQLPGDNSDVSIVVFTANHPKETLEVFRRTGVTDVLLKPIEPNALTRILLRYIPQSKLIDPEEAVLELEELEEDNAAATGETPEFISHLCQFLKEVDGLDCMTGMFYAMNDEDNYYRVLKASLEAVITMSKRLNEFCQHSPAHSLGKQKSTSGKKHSVYGLEEVHMDAHALKGIFASIGLDALSQAAAEIERAVEKDDRNYLTEQLPDLILWIDQVFQDIDAAVRQYESLLVPMKDEPSQSMCREDYEELIEDTLMHVARYEIEAILNNLERLKRSTLDPVSKENIEKAISAAHIFDYRMIEERLKLAEYR